MAKLNYNEQLVNSSLDLLKNAENELSNTDENINSAISKIRSAKGIEFVDTAGFVGIAGMGKQCQELIETAIKGINGRVELIKEYNEDYSKIGSAKKIFSTVGLGVVKFIEGALTAGENITDGFASAVGFFAGLLGGEKGRNWRDTKVAEYVKRDYIGDRFRNLYEGSLSDMVKASAMSIDGLGAKICKIAGTATGYSLALAGAGALSGGIGSVVTGGSKTIFAASKLGAQKALYSLGATMVAAGAGGIGSGTELALQKGLPYNNAIWHGAKTGAVQVGLVLTIHSLIRLGKFIFNSESESLTPIIPVTLPIPTIPNIEPIIAIPTPSPENQTETAEEYSFSTATESEEVFNPSTSTEPEAIPGPLPVPDPIPGVPEPESQPEPIPQGPTFDPVPNPNKPWENEVELEEPEFEFVRTVYNDFFEHLNDQGYSFIIADQNPDMVVVHNASEFIEHVKSVDPTIPITEENALRLYESTIVGSPQPAEMKVYWVNSGSPIDQYHYYETAQEFVDHIASNQEPELTEYYQRYSTQEINTTSSFSAKTNFLIQQLAKRLGIDVAEAAVIFALYEAAQYGLSIPTQGLSMLLPG